MAATVYPELPVKLGWNPDEHESPAGVGWGEVITPGNFDDWIDSLEDWEQPEDEPISETASIKTPTIEEPEVNATTDVLRISVQTRSSSSVKVPSLLPAKAPTKMLKVPVLRLESTLNLNRTVIIKFENGTHGLFKQRRSLHLKVSPTTTAADVLRCIDMDIISGLKVCPRIKGIPEKLHWTVDYNRGHQHVPFIATVDNIQLAVADLKWTSLTVKIYAYERGLPAQHLKMVVGSVRKESGAVTKANYRARINGKDTAPGHNAPQYVLVGHNMKLRRMQVHAWVDKGNYLRRATAPWTEDGKEAVMHPDEARVRWSDVDFLPELKALGLPWGLGGETGGSAIIKDWIRSKLGDDYRDPTQIVRYVEHVTPVRPAPQGTIFQLNVQLVRAILPQLGSTGVVSNPTQDITTRTAKGHVVFSSKDHPTKFEALTHEVPAEDGHSVDAELADDSFSTSMSEGAINDVEASHQLGEQENVTTPGPTKKRSKASSRSSKKSDNVSSRSSKKSDHVSTRLSKERGESSSQPTKKRDKASLGAEQGKVVSSSSKNEHTPEASNASTNANARALQAPTGQHVADSDADSDDEPIVVSTRLIRVSTSDMPSVHSTTAHPVSTTQQVADSGADSDDEPIVVSKRISKRISRRVTRVNISDVSIIHNTSTLPVSIIQQAADSGTDSDDEPIVVSKRAFKRVARVSTSEQVGHSDTDNDNEPIVVPKRVARITTSPSIPRQSSRIVDTSASASRMSIDYILNPAPTSLAPSIPAVITLDSDIDSFDSDDEKCGDEDTGGYQPLREHAVQHGSVVKSQAPKRKVAAGSSESSKRRRVTGVDDAQVLQDGPGTSLHGSEDLQKLLSGIPSFTGRANPNQFPPPQVKLGPLSIEDALIAQSFGPATLAMLGLALGGVEKLDITNTDHLKIVHRMCPPKLRIKVAPTVFTRYGAVKSAYAHLWDVALIEPRGDGTAGNSSYFGKTPAVAVSFTRASGAEVVYGIDGMKERARVACQAYLDLQNISNVVIEPIARINVSSFNVDFSVLDLNEWMRPRKYKPPKIDQLMEVCARATPGTSILLFVIGLDGFTTNKDNLLWLYRKWPLLSFQLVIAVPARFPGTSSTFKTETNGIRYGSFDLEDIYETCMEIASHDHCEELVTLFELCNHIKCHPLADGSNATRELLTRGRSRFRIAPDTVETTGLDNLYVDLGDL